MEILCCTRENNLIVKCYTVHATVSRPKKIKMLNFLRVHHLPYFAPSIQTMVCKAIGCPHAPLLWPPKRCQEHWCCLQNGHLENPAQTCTQPCSRDSCTDLTALLLCFCRELTMNTWDTCTLPYRDENPVCCSCTVLYVGSRGAEPQQQAAAEWRENHLIQGGSRANQRKWVSIARE